MEIKNKDCSDIKYLKTYKIIKMNLLPIIGYSTYYNNFKIIVFEKYLSKHLSIFNCTFLSTIKYVFST